MLTLSLLQIADPQNTWGCVDIPFVNCLSNIRHLLHHYRCKILTLGTNRYFQGGKKPLLIKRENSAPLPVFREYSLIICFIAEPDKKITTGTNSGTNHFNKKGKTRSIGTNITRSAPSTGRRVPAHAIVGCTVSCTTAPGSPGCKVANEANNIPGTTGAVPGTPVQIFHFYHAGGCIGIPCICRIVPVSHFTHHNNENSA